MQKITDANGVDLGEKAAVLINLLNTNEAFINAAASWEECFPAKERAFFYNPDFIKVFLKNILIYHYYYLDYQPY